MKWMLPAWKPKLQSTTAMNDLHESHMKNFDAFSVCEIKGLPSCTGQPIWATFNSFIQNYDYEYLIHR